MNFIKKYLKKMRIVDIFLARVAGLLLLSTARCETNAWMSSSEIFFKVETLKLEISIF